MANLTSNKEFNLGWGDPITVRQALAEVLGPDFSLAKIHLDRMGYPAHSGNIKLIEQLKVMAERQSGHKPKHLFVTCGATGAISAALYALKDSRTDWVVTNKRHYPIYPAIIDVAGLEMIHWDKKDRMVREDGLVDNDFISLVDSPSAPEGIVYPFKSVDIWDCAYSSLTYGFGSHTPIKYRIMCGSVSKTLGLAGLRVGWASTDEDLLANALKKYVTSSYAGLSSLSMDIAESILDSLDQDLFEIKSRLWLNDNKEQVQKILTKFGQGEIPSRGMFAILQLGKAERKAFERAGIVWLSGTQWGEDDSWARLSLGQDRQITKAAVKAVLK